jgi:regulator of protease activity HflC (stomatin/prohibitin superfamily)
LQTIYPIKTARDTINLYGNYEQCKQEPDDCDDIAISIPSKEGLEIIVDVSIFYRVKSEKAVDIVKLLTTDYVWGTVILSIRSATRDVAGGMAVTELYGTGREQLEQGIFNNLNPKFEKDGFVLEEVLIRDVAIPEQIKNAVESKQKTEQEMLQKETEVKKEKLEAERIIAEATGVAESKLKVATAEAEAIRIQGQALRENPDVVQLRWVEKWDGKLPTYMLGQTGSTLIQIPTNIG